MDFSKRLMLVLILMIVVATCHNQVMAADFSHVSLPGLDGKPHLSAYSRSDLALHQLFAPHSFLGEFHEDDEDSE